MYFLHTVHAELNRTFGALWRVLVLVVVERLMTSIACNRVRTTTTVSHTRKT